MKKIDLFFIMIATFLFAASCRMFGDDTPVYPPQAVPPVESYTYTPLAFPKEIKVFSMYLHPGKVTQAEAEAQKKAIAEVNSWLSENADKFEFLEHSEHVQGNVLTIVYHFRLKAPKPPEEKVMPRPKSSKVTV